MEVSHYFAAVSRELQHQSERVRESFKSHRLTAGENREALLGALFQRHLPKTFGVGTGLVMSREGEVSNQADLVVYDQLLNAPLNSDLPSAVFPVESVYALVEAKTNLTPHRTH